MADDHVYFDMSNWEIVSDGTVAMIANMRDVHPKDVDMAAQEYASLCGDCSFIRGPLCSGCFHLPYLLIHDSLCGHG